MFPVTRWLIINCRASAASARLSLPSFIFMYAIHPMRTIRPSLKNTCLTAVAGLLLTSAAVASAQFKAPPAAAPSVRAAPAAPTASAAASRAAQPQLVDARDESRVYAVTSPPADPDGRNQWLEFLATEGEQS